MRPLLAAETAQGNSEPRGSRCLVLILALGLAHGLLYAALFPPWQHSDEPTHFEYVRLIAERRRLPQQGDYDLPMRREIAASMQAAGFWKGKEAPILDLTSDTPPEIGVSELVHPPLYYLLLALPQSLLTDQNVEVQLAVARLCSVLLYLVVLASAYGLVRELSPQRPWLAVTVAATLALLAPFAERMSAVNNDAGAAAVTSLFLWAGIRMARRGPTIGRATLVVVLVGACLATKSTAGVVAISALLALVWSYVPPARRKWAGMGLFAALSIGLGIGLAWHGRAAYWINEDPPSAPNRTQVQTPLDDSALVLSLDGSHPWIVQQELPWREGLRLRGRTVTYGAWIRAACDPGGFVVLNLYDGRSNHWYRLDATTEWEFHAITATVAVDAPAVSLAAILPQREGAARQVYADGLVLVEGAAPLSTPPAFLDGEATVAQWGNRQAVNLLRNASAQRQWPGLRGWIGDRKVNRGSIAQIWFSVLDWPRTGSLYRLGFAVLFRSFWGSFGWNHLLLPDACFYPLGIITGLAGLGCGLGWIRRRRREQTSEPGQGRAGAVLAVALLAAWGGVVLRIHPVWITRYLFWPVARYADTAIVPSALALCVGLAELVPPRWRWVSAWLGALGLLTLEAVACWLVILPYYYG